MDGDHNMTGGFFDLLSPYALLGGVVTLTLFLFHGAVFLALRTDGPVAVGGRPRPRAGSRRSPASPPSPSCSGRRRSAADGSAGCSPS